MIRSSTRLETEAGLDKACKRLRKLSEDQTSPQRRHMLEALEKGLRAADPGTFVRKKARRKGHHLSAGSHRFDLSRYDRVLVIGGGKASAGMALEIERILGDRLTAGTVNAPHNLKPRTRSGGILFHPATHPLPTEKGVRGVQQMLELVGRASRRDLIVCVLSGGGSALMPLSAPGLTIEDEQKTTEALMKSGARIDEINTVRKHLSAIKGGRLAERLFPATVLSLIISDVAGNKVENIASGPTAPDTSTYADARKILSKFQLDKIVPASVRRILERGNAGYLPETPKPGSKVFDRVYNVIVGSNRDSCVAAAQLLRQKGYRTLVLSTRLQGEARHVGTVLASILSDVDGIGFSAGSPFAIVAGGETTVAVKGEGVGGRNQELVLSAALGLSRLRRVTIASMSTDGVDGPSPAAGALADGETIEKGLEKRMNAETFLARNDSFTFFRKIGDDILTGPTGTNVNDLVTGVSMGKRS